jgi:ATP-dependent DNA ligase
LFRLACRHDLEGIIAKRKFDPYLEGHASWLKIRNREYSQWVGGKNCSSGSAGAIRISKSGMAALARNSAGI